MLYHTRPDRLQFAQPDWEFVIYTVKVSADGRASQRLITRRQASDHALLALRRGENEVLLQRVATSDGSDAHIERWVVGTSSMASRVPIPSPRWPDGEQRYWGQFFGPTSDGNLFFASVAPENRSTAEHSVAWFKATPDGRVLGQGSLTRGEIMAPGPSIIADAGRGAMMLTVSSDAESGIETRLDVPIHREVAGRKVRAAVALEKRLFVVSADGRSFAESPALERMLVWLGDMGVPQDLSAAEMLRQSQLQMTMLAQTDRAVEARRRVVSLDGGLKRIEMVEPMRGRSLRCCIWSRSRKRWTPGSRCWRFLRGTRYTCTRRARTGQTTG